LTNNSDEIRPSLLVDVAQPLLWSGRPGDAEARARQGLAANRPAELDGLLRARLVAALTAQGRHLDVIEEAVRAARRPELTSDARSLLFAVAANALDFIDDLDGAATTAEAAVAVGTPAGSEGADLGLLVLSDIARVRGNLTESLEYAARVIEHAGTRTDASLSFPPKIFLAMALAQLDRFDEAHDALRLGREYDEQLGNVSQLAIYHYASAPMLYSSADWDDATAEAQAGLATADEIGLEMLRAWPHETLALIAIGRGDLDNATAHIAAIDSCQDAQGAGQAHALLDEARGDTAGAFATLARAWDRDAARGVIYRRRRLGPDLVRLALAAGDRRRAEAVAGAVEQASALAPVHGLEGAALRCRGLVNGDNELLLGAVDAYRHSPRSYERAAACEDAGTALAHAGHFTEGSTLFDEALDVYEHAHAERNIARALGTMRQLGLGRKRRGARKRPATGWESLTPSELEVVRLATEGLTNPQIGQRLYISRRTVQTHLAHAFQKLQLTSRIQLAAEAAKRGPS
jgi:ATP/maltotriose-dependent transcriptional regulator MalT